MYYRLSDPMSDCVSLYEPEVAKWVEQRRDRSLQ